jgi:archaellum biogenesis protein FlaJ (TadC family)
VSNLLEGCNPVQESSDEQLSQPEFEEARRRLRFAVMISAVMDLFIAVVLLILDIPIGALILLAFAIIGTPIVLAGLDRSWRKRGYDV